MRQLNTRSQKIYKTCHCVTGILKCFQPPFGFLFPTPLGTFIFPPPLPSFPPLPPLPPRPLAPWYTWGTVSGSSVMTWTKLKWNIKPKLSATKVVTYVLSVTVTAQSKGVISSSCSSLTSSAKSWKRRSSYKMPAQ